MEKQEYVVIINPKAGNGKGLENIRIIEDFFNKKDLPLKVCKTEYAGHATELAKEEASDNKVVIAVGGDGTVREVALGLLESSAVLGIIPQGSGNGLARHLGISQNINKALEQTISCEVINMDIGLMNNEMFFVTAGIGLDAEVSAAFAKADGRGLKNYVKSFFKVWPSYESKEYKLRIDNGEECNIKALMMTFANAGQWGNNFWISPEANVNDNKLNLCLLKSINIFNVWALALRLFFKKNVNHKSAMDLQFTSIDIQISEESNIYGHLDGEPIEISSSKIMLRLAKQSLRVLGERA